MVTEFAGSVAPAADINYLATPSLCQCAQQTAQAQTGWTNQTTNAVTFVSGSTLIDTDSIHSESSNTSRFVIGKRLGWWQVDGLYCPATNAGLLNARAILGKNGTLLWGSFGGHGPTSTAQFISVPTKPGFLVQATSASDYVELFGYESITAAPTGGTAVSTPYVASGLTARWVRDS